MLVFHGGPMDGMGLEAQRPVPRVVELDHDSNAGLTYIYERFDPAEEDGNFHYAMAAWKPRTAG
jgi:hypothetical protein